MNERSSKIEWERTCKRARASVNERMRRNSTTSVLWALHTNLTPLSPRLAINHTYENLDGCVSEIAVISLHFCIIFKIAWVSLGTPRCNNGDLCTICVSESGTTLVDKVLTSLFFFYSLRKIRCQVFRPRWVALRRIYVVEKVRS
jgi:hypothetical protein